MFTCVALAGTIFLATDRVAISLDSIERLQVERGAFQAKLIIETQSQTPIDILIDRDDTRREPLQFLTDCVAEAEG